MARPPTATPSRRWLPLAVLAAIAALLLLGAWTLAHRGPTDVPLARLAAEQEAYDGAQVETVGLVRRFEDPGRATYYVLEDPQLTRVALEPAAAASPYQGQPVAVVGTFHVDASRGRWIAILRLTPPPPDG